VFEKENIDQNMKFDEIKNTIVIVFEKENIDQNMKFDEIKNTRLCVQFNVKR
jgi:hypothetical protein